MNPIDKHHNHEDREAMRAEGERERLTRCYTHDPDGGVTITEHLNDAYFIVQLERIAKLLASTDTAVVEWVETRPGGTRCVATKLGQQLITLCRNFDPAFPARHVVHTLNSWIETMLAAITSGYATDGGFAYEFGETGILPEDGNELARVAEFVRAVCHSPAFAARLKAERKLAQQDFRSACMYMENLFAHHSRLLVLRIDLYYRGDGREWARTDAAAAAFDKFMASLRRSRIVPDVLGCLTRREEGAERGIHYHVLVALDGHKRKDAYGLTDTIGKAWRDRYSGGQGSFFNCYQRRGQYRFNGLGPVSLSDRHKLIGLREALRYMTKAEYRLKERTNAFGCRSRKSFRRGLIDRGAAKRGRPRASGHDLSLVRSVLVPTKSVSRCK